MTVRRKRGAVVVQSPPMGRDHGRIVATAPAVRARAEGADRRYAQAQIARALARARGDAKGRHNAKRRAEAARRELLSEPGGLAVVERVNAAIAGMGPALAAAARSHIDVRPFVEHAAATLLATILEHDARTTAGLALLGSFATSLALEQMAKARLFAAAPDDPGLDATAKIADRAASSASKALLTALHVERLARDARPPEVLPWLAGATTIAPDASGEREATDDGYDDEDAPTRHQGAAPGDDEDGGDTDVSPAEQGDRSMHWRRRKPEPQPEPPVESEHARERREAEHRRQLSMASWGRADGPTARWDSSLGRMVPIGQPRAAAPPPAPPPARRAPRAPDGPPAPPPGWTLQHQTDGTWRMAPPPAGARPSPESLATMREKGIPIPKHWGVADGEEG